MSSGPGSVVDVVTATDVLDTTCVEVVDASGTTNVVVVVGVVVVVVVATIVDSGPGPDSAGEHCARSIDDTTKEINFRRVRFLRITGA